MADTSSLEGRVLELECRFGELEVVLTSLTEIASRAATFARQNRDDLNAIINVRIKKHELDEDGPHRQD